MSDEYFFLIVFTFLSMTTIPPSLSPGEDYRPLPLVIQLDHRDEAQGQHRPGQGHGQLGSGSWSFRVRIGVKVRVMSQGHARSKG